MINQVLHVVGARPNFMKAAPVYRALADLPLRQTLVHTGQHYDSRLSDDIFKELQLPTPDINLGVGSGRHGQQTAKILVAMEDLLIESPPDLVLVYGDVNSTVAAALAAAKLGIAVGHVEAGLRSGDLTMPEEINRIVTDRLARWLFTPSADGDDNLLREGVQPPNIVRVGNVMIDTLIRLLPQATGEEELKQFRLLEGGRAVSFALVTLHRPSNVDDPGMLRQLIVALERVAERVPVVFPVHPRTRARLAEFGVETKRVTLSEPLTYLQFLGLQRHARVVVTDSGGIQEETTFLGVPCLTMRENTERPITIHTGTNQLIGRDTELMQREIGAILDGRHRHGGVPELWDGHAGQRIAEFLAAQ